MPLRHHTPVAQQSIDTAGILPAEPDIAQIEQEEYLPAPAALLVEHNGPVMSHELPARAGAAFGMIVPTTATSILGSDLKRKRALLISTDKPFYYMVREVSAPNSASAAVWPANVPLELRNSSEVWVACMSSTPTDTATISVVTETFNGV